MTLGEYLRSEREKRGISLEQVASATKIGIRVLYALEADQYAELPAKPFIRGFVTNYARYLGLKPSQVLADFHEFIESKSLSRPVRDTGHSGYAFERKEGEQSRMILWIVMGTMIVLGGLVMILFKPKLKHHRSANLAKIAASPSPTESSTQPSGTPTPEAAVSGVPSASPLVSPSVSISASASPAPSTSPSMVASPVPVASAVAPVAASPVASMAPAPAPSPSVSPSAEPSPSPSVSTKPDPLQSGVDYEVKEIRHRVILKALADVWVRYKVDDKTKMKFILRKGKVLVLRGKQAVRVQVSNPDSITLNYNSRGETPFADENKGIEFQGNMTRTFPPQAVDSLKESFKGERPLPATDGPAPSTESTTPSPSPSLSPSEG